MLRIIPIILVRADSSRLPGKVYEEIGRGNRIVDLLIEQTTTVSTKINNNFKDVIVERPVIATTSRAIDNRIYKEWNISCNIFRGATLPYDRVRQFSELHPNSFIWRINGDSPVIFTDLVTAGIRALLKSYDYICNGSILGISNIITRTFPYGISLEIISTGFFIQTDSNLMSKDIREHISPAISLNTSLFISLTSKSWFQNRQFSNDIHLTVDTKNDLAFFREMYGAFSSSFSAGFSVDDVINIYEKRRQFNC